MNNIGVVCGLAERMKIRVATRTVCEGQGSYTNINYLTHLGKHQLQWLADQINDGNIVLPEQLEADYIKADAERIRQANFAIDIDKAIKLLLEAREKQKGTL